MPEAKVECCANCVYFDLPKGHVDGDCRRYPPANTSYEFPNCYQWQWCGEYKEKK